MLKGWEFRKTNEPLELVEKEIPAAIRVMQSLKWTRADCATPM